MTIAEVKELYKGEYTEVEVYEPINRGKHNPNRIHTDNCYDLGDCSPHGNYAEDMAVGLYQLMSEEDYNHTLLSNADLYADFEGWYGDKNAKVLCIMIK